jgi:hypothetical protein
LLVGYRGQMGERKPATAMRVSANAERPERLFSPDAGSLGWELRDASLARDPAGQCSGGHDLVDREDVALGVS